MKHTMTKTLIVLAAVLAFNGSPAGADTEKVVPLRANLKGELDTTTGAAPATGVGTLCGVFEQQMQFLSLQYNADGTADGFGVFAQTCADGATLEGTFTAAINLLSGEFTGTFTVTGGTGRLAGVTGAGPSRGTLWPIGQTTLGFEYTYDGTVSIPGRSR